MYDVTAPTRSGLEQGCLGVDRGDLLVGQVRRDLERVDVVDAERQDVLVVDRVDDRVRVQLVAERLLGGAQLRVAARSRRSRRRSACR